MAKDFFIRKNSPGIHTKIAVITGIIFITFYSAGGIRAQQSSDKDPFAGDSLIIGGGMDYLVPTRYSNKITTISSHFVLWKRYFKNVSILMNAGITTTYAWGYSRQWYYRSSTVWEAYDYETSAFGAGPIVQIENAVIKTRHFSVVIEASAGCIRYDKHFPYGGDVYNFMLRTGPSLSYKINKKYFIKAGYRWMHVSNAQGTGNHNPYYEAQGINVSFFMAK